jgi:hypothetical protein
MAGRSAIGGLLGDEWLLAMETCANSLLNFEQRATYLAPGQRYARWDSFQSLTESVTILYVGRDAIGLTWVVYAAPDGDRSAKTADLFEAAILRGEIVPIASGAIGWCG